MRWMIRIGGNIRVTRPVSRVLCPYALRYTGCSHLSRRTVAGTLKPPLQAIRRADVMTAHTNSALHRTGFTRQHILMCSGGLLPRLSTFTASRKGIRQSHLCCTCPGVASGCCWQLPCSVMPGLSSCTEACPRLRGLLTNGILPYFLFYVKRARARAGISLRVHFREASQFYAAHGADRAFLWGNTPQHSARLICGAAVRTRSNNGEARFPHRLRAAPPFRANFPYLKALLFFLLYSFLFKRPLPIPAREQGAQ